MNKIIALALLAVGAVLLIYGLNANHSFASNVSKAFTGEPTDHAMWLMVSGVAIAALGVGALLIPRKR